MGCDCTNHIPPGVRRSEVEDFMANLGYVKLGGGWGEASSAYSYWKDDRYRYTTGVYAEITVEKETAGIKVWTRTTIWRSKFDSDFHNWTIRQLKSRFGGYFVSDSGRNRYLRFEGPAIEKAEGGSYAAYSKFHENLVRAQILLSARQSYEGVHPSGKIKQLKDLLDSNDPKVISANLIVPFFVSLVENYFRSTYVVLLKYCDRKSRIFQSARLVSSDLLAISAGELLVEDAVARRRSILTNNEWRGTGGRSCGRAGAGGSAFRCLGNSLSTQFGNSLRLARKLGLRFAICWHGIRW
jgi:hypothetical protein